MALVAKPLYVGQTHTVPDIEIHIATTTSAPVNFPTITDLPHRCLQFSHIWKLLLFLWLQWSEWRKTPRTLQYTVSKRHKLHHVSVVVRRSIFNDPCWSVVGMHQSSIEKRIFGGERCTKWRQEWRGRQQRQDVEPAAILSPVSSMASIRPQPVWIHCILHPTGKVRFKHGCAYLQCLCLGLYFCDELVLGRTDA